ncbi:MAG: hypothetical protein GX251_00145 [Firmicutes bacterium]|nr:hypothetical protein [Bacillota bacterium]
MQKKSKLIVTGSVLLMLLFVSSSSLLASGTVLMLGAGQDFRFDLPLEAGKSYTISMALRTDLADATVTMTLCQIRNNNEVIQHHISRHDLGDSEGWQVLNIPEVKTLAGHGRFELLLTADEAGRYYWRDLKVERIFAASENSDQYWSEKLAAQGTFYTGLVVDARHLDVKRGMSPRIYSESGQLLYGGVLAGEDLVQDRGVVGYGTELTSELLARITVDSEYPYVAPLVVKAIGAADAARTGVYVSEEDTRRILEAMVQYDFFARYAVIFLVK